MNAVYLDHAATTPVRAEAREAMLPYLGERFGNPSSVHRWGRQARNALEEARERVAAVLGAERVQVVFTGGGTEADNLAVLGRFRHACRENGAPGAVACSAIEHPAILGAAARAASEGAERLILGVDADGVVDVGVLDEVLAARPCVVSVMWGNNEIGTVQPVAEIGARCRSGEVPFHTDAVQAFGKVRVRVDEVACDLLSLSGHKFGGPKGIGVLYVRGGTTLLPLAHGGGQERELRPGTENVASAVGFAVAAELAAAEQEALATRLSALRERLEATVLENVPGATVLGAGAETRLPNIATFWIPDADGEGLLIGLDLEGVAASGGSACHSGTSKASHVLVALGVGEEPGAVVRVSMGHATTAAEIDRAAAALPRVAARVRAAVV